MAAANFVTVSVYLKLKRRSSPRPITCANSTSRSPHCTVLLGSSKGAGLWGRPLSCGDRERTRPHEFAEARGKKKGRRGGTARAKADGSEDLYETLGISPSASDRDIKQAYRRMALRYHPDVNKESDAQERFLRIKNAYQMLSDTSSRNRYDAVRRREKNPFGSWGGAGAEGRRTKGEEDFYGLAEFFRDLEIDLQKRQAEVEKGKSKSLWDELAELGEEFVEFLEKELDVPTPEQKTRGFDGEDGTGRRPKGAKSSDKSNGSSAPDDWRDIGRKVDEEMKGVNKKIEDDVEKMLSELKRDMGL